MAHLVVGKNCKQDQIIETMKGSVSFHQIGDYPVTFAIALGIFEETFDMATKPCISKDKNVNGLVSFYLIHWRNKFKKQATLGKLVSALRAAKLNDIAEAIESAEFYVKAAKKKAFKYLKKKSEITKQTSAEQQNTSYGGSQINRSTEKVLSQLREESTNEDGLLASKLKAQKKSREVTPEEWKCRTYNSAKNTTVSLIKADKEASLLGIGNYCLPGTSNGYALILNIMNYPIYEDPLRVGAQYDSLKLTQLLTQLGYEVTKFDDPNRIYSKEYVEGIIQQFRDRIKTKEPKSVVVFVGGHGTLGGIDMSEGKPINLFESIIYQFDTGVHEEFKNVPKIFIVNSCRVKDKVDLKINRIENAVVCYATLDLNYAFRHEEKGCYYVNSLVKIFSENAHHMHFTEMMEKVYADVRKQRIYTEEDEKEPSGDKQHPTHQVLGTFGELCFNVRED